MQNFRKQIYRTAIENVVTPPEGTEVPLGYAGSNAILNENGVLRHLRLMKELGQV